MWFVDFVSRNCPFLHNFDKNLFLIIWLIHVNKKCGKISFALSLGLFLFKCVSHISKNKFLSKLTKNEQFSVNKVQQITNDDFFPIKYKMCRMCDFHIDFYFQGKMDSQGTSRWAWPTPGSSMDCGVSGMDLWTSWMVFGNLYR